MTRDDYIWDPGAEPDPEVQELERSLARFRSGPVQPLDLDAATTVAGTNPGDGRIEPRRIGHDAAGRPALGAHAQDDRDHAGRYVWIRLALAASLLIIAGVWIARRPAAEAWRVTALEGAPRAAGAALSGTAPIKLGSWIETGAGARAHRGRNSR